MRGASGPPATAASSKRRPVEPLEERAQADAELHAGQVHPEALVPTGTEGDVGRFVAIEVPLVGVAVPGLVTVGRPGGTHQ